LTGHPAASGLLSSYGAATAHRFPHLFVGALPVEQVDEQRSVVVLDPRPISAASMVELMAPADDP
jgi:hypothetical protein